MSETVELAYTFTYRGIPEEEFAFLQDNFELGKEPSGQLGIAFSVQGGERDVFCRAISQLSIGESPTFAVCAVTCQFQLSEESWGDRVDQERRSVHLEKQLLDHFGSFTVGALRGYLHARLSKTPSRAVLPAINVSRLLTGAPLDYAMD